MTHLLATGLLRSQDIAPVDFVPIVALLVLLVEREIIRAQPGRGRPGRGRPVPPRVVDFAIFPLMVLFLLFVGLRAYTMIG